MSHPVSSQPTTDVPDPVARIAGVMAAFSAPWALCGGWAVDAWLGKQTRDHGDVDVSVFVQDQRALFEHLRDWQLIAHDPHVAGDTSAPWDGRPLDLPGHIHGRLNAGEAMPDRLPNPSGQDFGLDIQLDDREGDEWIVSREPLISMPLRSGIAQSPWGLPALVPEVLLFYKADVLRRRDHLDFRRLLPILTPDQREWLRHAILLLGHPWLQQLKE